MRASVGAVLVLCLGASACVGRIEDATGIGPGPGQNNPPPGGIADGGTPSTPSPDAGTTTMPPVGPPPTIDECMTQPFDVGLAPTRRLSHFELASTLRDLFPGVTLPSITLAPDRAVLGFENNVEAQIVSPVLVEQYQTTAVNVATAVVASPTALYASLALPAGTTCPPANAAAQASCGREVVDALGLRAFRRPLTADERTRFGDFFATALARDNYEVALTLLVEAMILSPQFLYRVELGVPPADPDAKLTQLDPYEIAARLSYFFWSSMPDREFLDAAAAGQLATKEQRETQARRMVADPRARAAVVNFHRQWLAFDRLDGVNKDPTAHPTFNDTLRAAMKEEQRRFVEHAVFDDGKTLGALLTGTKTFVNAPLAAVYGVAAPAGDSWSLVDLNASQRAGVLTTPSFLAAHAHEVEPSPVLRGVFVIERLLCQTILPPSVGVNTTPPSANDHPGPTTNRQRYAEHVNNAACAGCHDTIDGFGFALESYDSLGAYRTIDNGLPVDTATEIVGTSDVDGPIAGPIALAQSLARSKDVQYCMTTELFRFAFGRVESTADRCNITKIDQAFGASGQNIQELMVAFATSDAFVTIPASVSR